MALTFASVFIGMFIGEHLETEREREKARDIFLLHSEVAHFAIIIPLCIEK